MSKTRSNTLYNFLHYELTHQRLDAKLASQIRVQKTQDDVSCYFVLLPKSAMDVVFGNEHCSIVVHHVSIYENHDVLSEPCEYQYGAMLRSNDGKNTYEFQVYFDKSDRKVGSVVLKRIDRLTKEKTSIAIKDSEYELLAEFAMNFSMSMMAPLHQLHQRGQAQLEVDLAVFLCQVDNLPCSTVQEIELILSRTEELKQRTAFMDCEVTCAILKHTELCFQWMRDDLLDDARQGYMALVILMFYLLCKSILDKVFPVNPHERSGQLVQAIDDLWAIKSKYSSDDVDELLDFHNAVEKAFLLLVNSSDRELVIQNGIYVNAMYFCSRIRCVKQLSRALEQNDVSVFDVLQGFTSSLSDNMLAMAIQSNNPAQLARLLKRDNFPVNRLLIKVEDKYYTLLEFAYEHDQIECFRQLLAYGASVFNSVMDDLPLVQRIMLAQKPLFCGVLMMRYNRDLEKTSNSAINPSCSSSSASSSILSRFKGGLFRAPTGVGSDEIEEQGYIDAISRTKR